MPGFDTPLHTNDQSLNRVTAAGLPVVLVLYGGLLNPALDAALQHIATAEADALLVAQMNAVANPHTAARASGLLPALITFQDGAVFSEAGGITPNDVHAHVDYVLGRGPNPETMSEVAPATSDAHGDEAPSVPITVTDATFQQEVIASDLPVLVDLWAAWCGPCHMIAPIVERMAQDYAGRLKVVKLNVDENPQTAMQYQVQGIPTLLIFHAGRVVDRMVGAAPEPILRGHVDAVLRRT